MKFHQKVAVVTGGGTGVGRAVSLKLAGEGAHVVVNYSRSEREAAETVREIAQRGGSAVMIRANVAAEQEVENMFAEVERTYGTIHYLVNNASITEQIRMDDLEAVTDEIWDKLLAVNVKGMFYCAKAAAPFMKKNREGAILNVGSIAGVTGLGSSLPYAVSKAAVHGLTKSLAHALAPEIRVNSIAPGAISTRWWEGNEEKMRRLSGALPLGRISTPEDIAELICALLQQESLTGQVIIADNGQTL
ncbi:SDR family NAD(P)-dependent oxidoreductase [Paenibacillus caui]|uniref:SDR family NAD(P)-dependent oxidoreductase n=1 Tax=Paenibacillus caui TaxID=2873927 RepID=UPI001CA9D50B|nr:SDR family oxidoreductase [Paenibacillus caui]